MDESVNDLLKDCCICLFVYFILKNIAFNEMLYELYVIRYLIQCGRITPAQLNKQ